MLGKLFRHEWKRTSKMGCLILLGILIVTILGVLGFSLPFSNAMNENAYSAEDEMEMVLMTLVSMATIMVYVMTLMAAVYGMLIYLGVHIYKTTYADEGYLTHTLPVTPRQIIFSKVLNAGIWYGFVMISMVISVVALMFSMMYFMEGADGFMSEMSILWEDLQYVFESEMGGEVVRMIVTLILIYVIAPFSTMMTLLGALSIGQLASKYKAIMGILAYFGVCMVNGIIGYIIQFFTMFSNGFFAAMNDSEPSLSAAYEGALITSVIMTVVFYFVAHGIMTKKLNLE